MDRARQARILPPSLLPSAILFRGLRPSCFLRSGSPLFTMRFQSILALSAPLLALAAPMKYPRAASANDITVLKFAHVLEQLETEFYKQALAKFQPSDFTSAGFVSASVPVEQFTSIATDEATHTSVLASVLQSLGQTPVTGCKFDFSSALTDVKTMAPIARLVENVGVSAYLGGAALIDDRQLLVAAGTILTDEARHQTVLNMLNGGVAIPSAFDVALSPSQVLALAGGFISGCDLGIPGDKTLEEMDELFGDQVIDHTLDSKRPNMSDRASSQGKDKNELKHVEY